MHSRGRVFDNIFVERLWRTVKYEDIYLKEYASVPDLLTGLADYFQLYNYERPHQSLDYRVPANGFLPLMDHFYVVVIHLNFANLWPYQWDSPHHKRRAASSSLSFRKVCSIRTIDLKLVD
jgi:hypothetical protein